MGVGGLVAGMVGVAIGEVTNTRLHSGKGIPIDVSTGTSTLVLFVTVLAANVTNLLVLETGVLGVDGTVNVPWAIAAIIAPVVVVGGQLGSWLNSRLPEPTTVRLLLVTYGLVGVVTVGRIVLG